MFPSSEAGADTARTLIGVGARVVVIARFVCVARNVRVGGERGCVFTEVDHARVRHLRCGRLARPRGIGGRTANTPVSVRRLVAPCRGVVRAIRENLSHWTFTTTLLSA